MLRIQAAEKDLGKRLDHFLQAELEDVSRSRLQQWIKEERVLVNGLARKPSYVMRGDETVDVIPTAPPTLRAFAEDIPLDVLFLDEDVIAVNKPAGLVVHAGAGRHSGTLVNALLHRFEQLSGAGGGERPGIVHRLDRETSGVLLVARNDRAHRHLAAQFASRKVTKDYVALVHGRVAEEEGRIDAPVTRDPRRRTRMTARLEHGRAAITDFKVLARWEAFTLLAVRIGTGRTHQIRAHMASRGHPVAGDRLYGAPAAGFGRFFLHALRIGFDLPSGAGRREITAPLPAELREWLESLGAPAAGRAIIEEGTP